MDEWYNEIWEFLMYCNWWWPVVVYISVIAPVVVYRWVTRALGAGSGVRYED